MIRQFLCLILGCILLAGCGSESMRESFKQKSADEMFTIAKAELKAGHYNQASLNFEDLNQIHPFSKNSEMARILGIYSYVMDKEYSKAIVEVEYFQKVYPRSPFSDWALYIQAYGYLNQYRNWFQRYLESDRARNDIVPLQQALYASNRLMTLYPNSRYVLPAKQITVQIERISAKENIDVATFYLERHAYLAAANRASNFLKMYSDSCFLPQAVAILEQAYDGLGLVDWKKDVVKLKKINQFSS